ncbi:hypothetical protein EXN61_21945 [Agrobacterium tumefaciens]|uniref:Uncharacterized protein n=1 Tax=Agrobacterium tumefaciens TaxID=358 RepID=A0A546XRY6_AGRTU|nr:hypothetical protein [Agrobacterium tumefaciens]TRB03521.1 hypothetical protein EXN61_21945 [Agrobacterium tumefaciens]
MTEQSATLTPAQIEAREWWQGKFILSLMTNDAPEPGQRPKIGLIHSVTGVYGGRLVAELRMMDGTFTSTAIPVQFFEIDRLISTPNPAIDGNRMFSSYGDAMAFAIAANADTPMGEMTAAQIEAYRESLSSDTEARDTARNRTRRNA